jgi:SAM-dependent methyltransferase
MYWLCRLPSDRRILPVLAALRGKDILDVGLGTGHYTRLLVPHNRVVGVDQHPHLCRLDVEVRQGDATRLGEVVGDERFDVVLSTWMTDYLDGGQLGAFFAESRRVLRQGGRLLTTVVSAHGLGLLYVTLARLLKGVRKHGYTRRQITRKLTDAGFRKVEIIHMTSYLRCPWAYLVSAE